MRDSNAAMNPYQCPSCGAPIPSGRTCKTCPNCYAKLPKAIVESNRPSVTAGQELGSAAGCVTFGLIALGVGLYFLINPSPSGYGNFANMHALAVGQALTVAGAVLLGFGIRPR